VRVLHCVLIYWKTKKADILECRPSLPEHRRNVYVIGQKAIEDELAELGLEWHGGTVRSCVHSMAQEPVH
jgi:hypothetical protein